MQLNDENILTVTVHEPIEGRWWADVALPSGDTPSGQRTLSIGDVEWIGTVAESTVDGGRRRVRIVGGNNALRNSVKDRYYRGANTLGQIASDLLTEAGESLDPSSDLLSREMPTWQRFAGPAVEALTDLVHANKMAWRITRAGQVRLTALPHLFPGATPEGTLLEDDGRSILMAVQSPAIEPGITVSGHPIHRITWEATAERITGVLHYHEIADVRRVQDYRSIAEAGIDSQRADGSLDVIAASRYGLTEVPLYAGLPGVDVRVDPGGQTLVAYAGSPRRPMAFGHRGGGSGLKIGTLVFIVAPSGSIAGAVIDCQWFNADEAGDRAAAELAVSPNFAVPIEFTTAVQNG